MSRERYRLPLNDTQRGKWEAIGQLLDYRVLAAAQSGSPCYAERFMLAGPSRVSFLDGALYYLRLPRRIARELRLFDPDVAWVQGVHEALAFLIGRVFAPTKTTKLLLDVQGDWHAATRLYGSRLRRLLNPLNDFVGHVAVRRADAVRTLSPSTSALVRQQGIEPIAEFAPFVDSAAFLAGPTVPLPERPTALFVGVLERYKGFDTLAAAWPRVRAATPDTVLNIVGQGTLAPTARELTRNQGSWMEARLDRGQLGCVPADVDADRHRREDRRDAGRLRRQVGEVAGEERDRDLRRRVIEPPSDLAEHDADREADRDPARGRTVVGADAGGIPDLVEHGVTALLVPPNDPEALATALIRILGNRTEAERLGAAARRVAEQKKVAPEHYAAQLAAAVDALCRRTAASTVASPVTDRESPAGADALRRVER